MILETLPETFDNVKLNCSFEWLTYPLTGPKMGLPAAVVLFNMCMKKIKEASLVMNNDSNSKIHESAKTSNSEKSSLPPVREWCVSVYDFRR